ncbi:MAG: lanthionine synthetase LanC family protein [Cyclobacteriaceae bacterium]|jgi:lantibiotic modifying enzyme
MFAHKSNRIWKIPPTIIPQLKKNLDEYFTNNGVWSLNYKLGYVLFEAYYLTYTNKKDFKRLYENLNICLESIDVYPYKDASLFNGISGLGWVLEHFRNIGVLSQGDIFDTVSQIDALIESELKGEQVTVHDLDLFYGIVGITVYLLEKNQSRAKSHLLTIAFQKICSTIELMNESTKIDLGMPHGLSGVIIILTKLLKFGFDEKLLLKNLSLCSGVILNSRLVSDELSLFPTETTSTKPSRLAWCYGDLSILFALARANVHLRSETLNYQIHLLHQTCQLRKLDKSGVFTSNENIDTGLCHGSLGIAYVLNKISQATNDSTDGQILYWIEQSFYKMDITKKFLNFKTAYPEEGGIEWGYDGGLVDGLAGIGLMLIGLSSTKCTAWDSLFLLDID